MTDLDLATAGGQDRYVPSATRDITSAGHEGVYEWIAENLVTNGMRALDFGCGTGYGAALLARAGAIVDGVDNSPAAIEYATRNFGAPGVRFFVADLMKPLPDVCAPRSYDLVASSEVLEHVVDPSPSSAGWRSRSMTAAPRLSAPRTGCGRSTTSRTDISSPDPTSWSSRRRP